jgi:hypothetical protein
MHLAEAHSMHLSSTSRIRVRLAALVIAVGAIAGLQCGKIKTGCGPVPPAPSSGTKVSISNRQKAATTVYVAFGSDSKVGVKDWAFCQGTGLTCSFQLAGETHQPLPTGGAYLNATLSFGAAVTCNVTKAELNVNNPAWFDTYDVSLVDGYSNQIGMLYSPPGPDAGPPVALGPPKGATGNEKVLGVYPFGCDICVARQSPPCGITKGTEGCKAGTQNNPAVPCQYQGAVKGGGGAIEVVLFP